MAKIQGNEIIKGKSEIRKAFESQIPDFLDLFQNDAI